MISQKYLLLDLFRGVAKLFLKGVRKMRKILKAYFAIHVNWLLFTFRKQIMG
jgi:hypothetical protein